MVGALDREPNIIETDQDLAEYGESLLLKGHNTQKQIDQIGPIEVWRILGATAHIVTVNTHAFCENHDEDEATVFARLEPSWRCFAVVINPEDEWEIRHWEPIRDARPLVG